MVGITLGCGPPAHPTPGFGNPGYPLKTDGPSPAPRTPGRGAGLRWAGGMWIAIMEGFPTRVAPATPIDLELPNVAAQVLCRQCMLGKARPGKSLITSKKIRTRPDWSSKPLTGLTVRRAGIFLKHPWEWTCMVSCSPSCLRRRQQKTVAGVTRAGIASFGQARGSISHPTY